MVGGDALIFTAPNHPGTESPAEQPAARFLTDEQRAVIAIRLPICQPCEHYRGHSVMTVACAKCGCAGLSLLTGSCPSGLWPKP